MANLLKEFFLRKHAHGFAALAALIIFSSCATTDCPNCEDPEISGARGKPRWNVAFRTPEIDLCTEAQILSIATDIRPDSIPSARGAGYIRVISMPCKDGSVHIYKIPAANVVEITDMSDPLTDPETWEAGDPCICCCRERTGLLFFDKFELSLWAGYRGEPDPIFYPSANGGELYEPEFLSFDRGGSQMLLGLDLGLLWAIDRAGKFQIGLLTGAWPVDGSVFVPAAFRARYTFNQNPNPYEPYCNSWYVYGDLGLPLDFQTGAPIFGDFFDRQRYLADFGVGYDFAINCDMDFSLDLGIRHFNVPLPEIDCCPDITGNDRYFYRKTTAGILRFGITF